jgi:hypothetical protein
MHQPANMIVLALACDQFGLEVTTQLGEDAAAGGPVLTERHGGIRDKDHMNMAMLTTCLPVRSTFRSLEQLIES